MPSHQQNALYNTWTAPYCKNAYQDTLPSSWAACNLALIFHARLAPACAPDACELHRPPTSSALCTHRPFAATRSISMRAAGCMPSAVRSATPAFHVRSSGLLCPGRLQRVTRLPARSAYSVGSFRRNLDTFLLSFYYSVHSALQALWFCAT